MDTAGFAFAVGEKFRLCAFAFRADPASNTEFTIKIAIHPTVRLDTAFRCSPHIIAFQRTSENYSLESASIAERKGVAILER